MTEWESECGLYRFDDNIRHRNGPITRAENATCQRCQFFDFNHGKEGFDECRINPPDQQGFPEVSPNDWCGRWTLNPALDTQTRKKLRG